MSRVADSSDGIKGHFQAIYLGDSQKITVTSTSTQNATAFKVHSTIVRVFSTQNCFIQIGQNPTANTTTSTFIPGGLVDYFGIKEGDKVAVVRDTVDGVIYVTEGGR